MCFMVFYRTTACNATHGTAEAFLSVRLCLSNAWIVTKRKKLFVPTHNLIYLCNIYHCHYSCMQNVRLSHF